MGKKVKTPKIYPNRRRSSRQRGLSPILSEQKRQQRRRRLIKSNSTSPTSKKRQKSENNMSTDDGKDKQVKQVTPTPAKLKEERESVPSGVKTLTNLIEEVSSVRTQLDMGVPVESIKEEKESTNNKNKQVTEETGETSSNSVKRNENKDKSDDEYKPEDTDSDVDSENAVTENQSNHKARENQSDQKATSSSTLFNFGFKQSSAEDNENKITVNNGIKSISSDTPIAKEYIKKNEEKLVRIGIKMIKVEDGTFAKWDEEERQKKSCNEDSNSPPNKQETKPMQSEESSKNDGSSIINEGSKKEALANVLPPPTTLTSTSEYKEDNQVKKVKKSVQFSAKKPSPLTFVDSEDEDDSSGSEDSFNTIMSNETSVLSVTFRSKEEGTSSIHQVQNRVSSRNCAYSSKSNRRTVKKVKDSIRTV